MAKRIIVRKAAAKRKFTLAQKLAAFDPNRHSGGALPDDGPLTPRELKAITKLAGGRRGKSVRSSTILTPGTDKSVDRHIASLNAEMSDALTFQVTAEEMWGMKRAPQARDHKATASGVDLSDGLCLLIRPEKGYHTYRFVSALREKHTAAHVAYMESRNVGLGRGVLESRAYRASQIVRKRIEQFFGWGKTIGGLRKTRLKGVRRNAQLLYLTGAAYNLLRISRLSAATG